MAEFIFYRTGSGAEMRAKIIKRFKEGAARVEPFFLRRAGRDCGPFQGGHMLRLPPGAFRPAGPESGAAP